MLKKKTFIRAQFSSAFASLTDFAVTFMLTSVFSIWYVVTSFLGTVAGGITNFSINRNWTFNSREQSIKKQMMKYCIVWSGSMALNMLGVIFFTEFLKCHYLVSKGFSAGIVGFFYNYMLHQHYVFIKK